VDSAAFSALGEPNRLRIVELLASSPRSVGQIAAELGLRQPQATKHLQTLQRAGLVTMHPLGQRRIYALRREPFRELRGWSELMAAAHPSETVLEQYAKAIETEQALAQGDPEWARGRTLRFNRELRASAATVWGHWTSAELLRQWWSPEHFEVVDCRVDPVVDGHLEIVMQEGDGTRHASQGVFLALTPPRHLRFELGPLARDGTRLLTAVHDLRLHDRGDRTELTLAIRVTAAAPEAAPALAGMRLGWEQLLDKLARTIDRAGGKGGLVPSPRPRGQ
jgi:uncharacterized protein YndB with AHSA1/START domain/DNA-binding transcriptional ArsR family regulator